MHFSTMGTGVSEADNQVRYVEKLVHESLGYMTRIDQLRGKIQSALAIIESPAFGEYDGDLGDAVTILRSALHTEDAQAEGGGAGMGGVEEALASIQADHDWAHITLAAEIERLREVLKLAVKLIAEEGTPLNVNTDPELYLHREVHRYLDESALHTEDAEGGGDE